MVFRITDWPVIAHGREGGFDPSRPVALIDRRLVVACSAAARAEGVRVGLREREALQRCPEVELHPYDAGTDARRFEPVFAALTEIVPHIEVLQPGLAAMGARGPARYYHGEAASAQALRDCARDLGLTGVHIGIADGRFAAEQAARETVRPPFGAMPAPGIGVVEPGRSAAFLSALPVSRATDPATAVLLTGLGIRTLGALAALPEDAVRARFGPAGIAAHRRASGSGSAHAGPLDAEVRPSAAPRLLAEHLDLEPPLDSAEHLAFACSGMVEQFTAALSRERLVCTALRVTLVDDIDVRHERDWAHPRHFTAADILTRIRWQAAAMPRDDERAGAGVASVRITPVATDRVAAHEPGLWSSGPDERVHHHLSRAQSLLGPEGVTTATVTGGRLLRERQRFTPWGSAPHAQTGAGPWPGSLPAPHPTLVYDPPLHAELVDARGEPVSVDTDDLLTATPVTLRVEGREFTDPVQGWSSPWPIRERWWEGRPGRFRLQLELANGDAWLLLHECDHWLAEGRYD